jgi:hypothetical protein
MTITVIKRDERGREVRRYQGELIEADPARRVVVAYFQHEQEAVDLGWIVFRRGDRIEETFYSDRWYNVFKVFDGREGTLKGWYCNLTRPAIFTPEGIAADDLALDLFVSPEYAAQTLDAEEYEALALSEAERDAVQRAVEEIRGRVARREPPFES